MSGASPSDHSIPNPCSALLFFLLPALVLECFYFFLAEPLLASLGSQTAAVVTIRSRINIEVSVHLPPRLILVVVVVGIDGRCLPAPGESVECPNGLVSSSWVNSTAILLLWVFMILSICCCWVVVAVNCRVVPANYGRLFLRGFITGVVCAGAWSLRLGDSWVFPLGCLGKPIIKIV